MNFFVSIFSSIFLFLPSSIQASPPDHLTSGVSLVAEYKPTKVYENQRKPRIEKFKCNDNAAQILYKAGFRGWSHKMAWAITYRESKHQNLSESSPYFTGALGMWQIQTSAWSGQSWWSRSAMLDPLTQSKIVYKYMTQKGTYWIPWGLNPDGSLNTTQYGGWSSWQHQNWIMKPFQKGLALYPCKTLP